MTKQVWYGSWTTVPDDWDEQTKEVSLIPCAECHGAGEWDEGPIYRRWSEPEYRQVICPECEGTGRVLAEVEPVTLEDLEVLNEHRT